MRFIARFVAQVMPTHAFTRLVLMEEQKRVGCGVFKKQMRAGNHRFSKTMIKQDLAQMAERNSVIIVIHENVVIFEWPS